MNTRGLRQTLQYEKDLVLIADLYLRGETQHAIGEALGKDQSTISRALRTMRSRWANTSGATFDDARAQELARIDHLEHTYWEAWERSLEVKETTSTERKGAGDAAASKAAIRKETTAGNPAFLDGVYKCIQRRCALLGLDAPARQQISGSLSMPLVSTVVVELPPGTDEEATDGTVDGQ